MISFLSQKKPLFFVVLFLFSFLQAEAQKEAAPYNKTILATLAKMPQGGGYSTSRETMNRMVKAVSIPQGKLCVRPQQAQPSFCSEAIYLLLLASLEELAQKYHWQYHPDSVAQLVPHPGQADGVGAWGIWNANGPGAAFFFHETKTGENFTDLKKAQPGDFLKFFWSEEIGCKERGHLVLYLGTTERPSGTYLRFWSSNIPKGYGVKEVQLAHLHHLIFSRLTAPEALEKPLSPLPKNRYLANLLTQPSSFRGACQVAGIYGESN
jgi:hypothetical protein